MFLLVWGLKAVSLITTSGSSSSSARSQDFSLILLGLSMVWDLIHEWREWIPLKKAFSVC